MIDRALGFGSPVKREAYYFQFWPNTIQLASGAETPPSGSSVKFAVFKGPQKFNQNKTLMELSLSGKEKMPLKKCQLNFYLPDFNPNRNIDFVIKLFLVTGEDQSLVGEYKVSSAEFVQLFNQQKQNCSKRKQTIGSFVVEFDIFTERTRYNLEKIVKEVKEKQLQNDTAQTPMPSGNKQAPSETSSKAKRFERVKKEQNSQPRFMSSSEKKSQPETKKSEPGRQPRTERVQTPIKEQKVKVVPPLEMEQSKPKSKTNQLQSKTSTEEAASPALGTLHQARSVKPFNQKPQMRESSMVLSAKRQAQQKMQKKPETGYNLKIIVFLLISVFLMYQAMTPSRRAPYKASRR